MNTETTEKIETGKERPSYVETYLNMALAFSKRSHDQQTQVACLITDPQNRLISCGHNGFPKKCRDDLLPRTRPTNKQEKNDPWKNKYYWQIHAEINALANCSVRPPTGSISYITHQSCNPCIQALWQAGITKVYMINQDFHSFDEIQREVFDIFVDQSGIDIFYVNLKEL